MHRARPLVPAVGHAPQGPLETTYRCFQSSDFAEVCVYNTLCTDGDRVVLVDDSKPNGTAVPSHFGVGDHPGYVCVLMCRI